MKPSTPAPHDPSPANEVIASPSSRSSTRPQPFAAPRLGSRGLTVALIVMILTPVCLVAASIAMFPEVDKRELPVTILIDGYHYPAEVQASIDAFRKGEGEVLEPYLTVRNDGAEHLSSLFVTINKRFVFHASEPMGPGESRDFYLSRMQEPDGSMFWPNLYDIRRIVVKARLPSKKQAIYEAEWGAIVTRAASERMNPASATGDAEGQAAPSSDDTD